MQIFDTIDSPQLARETSTSQLGEELDILAATQLLKTMYTKLAATNLVGKTNPSLSLNE